MNFWMGFNPSIALLGKGNFVFIVGDSGTQKVVPCAWEALAI